MTDLPIGVVGAGPSGLVACRALREAGLPVEVFEAHDDVGGLWDFAREDTPLYASTRLISSKPLTELADWPMPKSFPDYPTHEQALEYLRGYAAHHELYSSIRFSARVVNVEPLGGRWLLRLESGEERALGGLVLAPGFHSIPRLPEVEGSFAGVALHSRDYLTPDLFKGRRALVVGGGNSGFDIACEAADHAAAAFLSLRRGYHVIPKHVLGRPADQLGELATRLRVPLPVRRAIDAALLRLVRGSLESYRLPEPDHRLFETHPVINSRVFEVLMASRLHVRPDLEPLDGEYVLFRDGTRERVDVIVYATGYQLAFPFLDEEHLGGEPGRPDLFLHVFSRRHENLAVCGMIQPDSGVWWLADEQAKLIATVFAARKDIAAARRIHERRVHERPDLGGGIRYLRSPRHHTEVEHTSYARLLRRLKRELS